MKFTVIIACLLSTQMYAAHHTSSVLSEFLIPDLCKIVEDYGAFEPVPECDSKRLYHRDRINSIAYSLDGTQFASAGDDEVIRTWDLLTGQTLQVSRSNILPRCKVNCVAYSPDGKQLVSVSHDHDTVRFWDASRGSWAFSYSLREEHAFTAVAYKHDSKQLATATRKNIIYLWNLPTEKTEEEILDGHENLITALAYRPDGQQLASASHDGTVRLWHLSTKKSEHVLQHPRGRQVTSIAYSPDGAQLASGADDNTVRVWDTHTGKSVRDLSVFLAPIHSVAYSCDGKYLAAASGLPNVCIWDARTHQVTQELPCDTIPGCVAFNPKNPYELAVSYGAALQIYRKLLLTNK